MLYTTASYERLSGGNLMKDKIILSFPFFLLLECSAMNLDDAHHEYTSEQKELLKSARLYAIPKQKEIQDISDKIGTIEQDGQLLEVIDKLREIAIEVNEERVKVVLGKTNGLVRKRLSAGYSDILSQIAEICAQAQDKATSLKLDGESSIKFNEILEDFRKLGVIY